MRNSTPALLVLMVLVAANLFAVSQYKRGAEYWHGRAEREIQLKESALHRARLCSVDLGSLQTEATGIRTDLTTLRTQTRDVQRGLRDLLLQQARLEGAVQNHCPAAMREIMAETTLYAPPQ